MEKIEKTYLYGYEIEDYIQGKNIAGKLINSEGKVNYAEAYDVGWSKSCEGFGLQGIGLGFLNDVLEVGAVNRISSGCSEIGISLAIIQLGIDVYRGNISSGVINLSKAATFSVIGKLGWKALKISAIGVQFIDYAINKLGTAAIKARVEVWRSAFHYYFERGPGKRNLSQWKKAFANAQRPKDMENIIRAYLDTFWREVVDPREYSTIQVLGPYKAIGPPLTSEKEAITNHYIKYRLAPYLTPLFSRMAIEAKQAQIKKIQEEYEKIVSILNSTREINVQVVGPKDLIKGLPVRIGEFMEGVTDASGEYTFKFTNYALLQRELSSADIVVRVMTTEGEEKLRKTINFKDTKRVIFTIPEISKAPDAVDVPQAPDAVDVPHIMGLSEAEARAELRKAGLGMTVAEKKKASDDVSGVTKWSPQGKVYKGHTISVWIQYLPAQLRVAIKDNKGELIENSQIKLKGPVSHPFKTFAQGLHTYTNLDKGEYVVSAQAKGYEPRAKGVSVDPEKKTGYAISLQLQPKELSLVGTVIDKETKERISAASARMSKPKPQTATTNSAGIFTMGGVHLGDTVEITVSAKGYKQYFKKGKIAAEVVKVTFPLTPAKGILSGTVVDAETGKPITGASVKASGPGINRTVTTSPGGKFTIDGLLEGDTIHVTISKDKYKTISVTISITGEASSRVFRLTLEEYGLMVWASPVDPGPHQGVTVTAKIDPRRAGIPIRLSIVGTDGYHNSKRTITDANGRATLYIPGAEKGVKDVVTVELPDHGVKKRLNYVF